ncbi:MAG: acyl-CoA carboxylase subunit beta [Dehalococcoidia bacterium]|nr:acyl-CoA carboxylase subunit beta [Dehalococcoidia bacterium]
MTDKLRQVEERRHHLSNGGPQAEIDRQHKSGKLTARERIDKLFDKGTFREIDLWIRPIKTGFDIDEKELPGDGAVTGIGEIDGRSFYVYAHDFTIGGATFGASTHHKITKLMEMALENRMPCIGLVDSAGERVQDWMGHPGFRPILGGKKPLGNALTPYRVPGILSGVVPQITVMLGPMYAGSAYSPTLTDFMIMRNKTAFMSVASPTLLKSVTFVDVTQEEIGGAVTHATVTGTADALVESDEEGIAMCRELASYVPLNCQEKPPVRDIGDDPNRRDEDLLKIVPADLSRPYDMHDVIASVVDRGKFLELQKLFAKSMIIGFARLDGQVVGIVANNPAENGGILTLDTCDKEARFIRWCDAFNVPLIFLVDTPGFAPNLEEEQKMDGLLRTAPKPVFAISEATVPMVQVNIGKCCGTARLVMGTLRMGLDLAYSWPSARVSRMDPATAVETIYKEEICSSPEPDRVRKEKLADMLANKVIHPFHAAEQAMINDIIDPRDTRPILIKALKTLKKKEPRPRPWRKHSLVPQ